jgi:hypothetical protein
MAAAVMAFTGGRKPSARRCLATATILLPSALFYALAHAYVDAYLVLLARAGHMAIAVANPRAVRRHSTGSAPRHR